MPSVSLAPTITTAASTCFTETIISMRETFLTAPANLNSSETSLAAASAVQSNAKRHFSFSDTSHCEKHSAERSTPPFPTWMRRSEEHTSELQSQSNLVCRLLL